MFLLVAAVAITAAPHEDFSKEHVVEVAEECKTEAGATEGQWEVVTLSCVNLLIISPFTEDVEHMMKHEPAASHEGKCLRSCMMKKFEIVS